MTKNPFLASPLVMLLIVLIFVVWAGYLAWPFNSVPVTPSPSPTLTATYTPTTTEDESSPKTPGFNPTKTIEITELIVTSPSVIPKGLVYIVANLNFDSSTVTRTWHLQVGKIRTGQGTNVILYEAPDIPGTYEVKFEAEYESQKVAKSVSVIVSPPIEPPTPTDTPTLTPTLTSTPTKTPPPVTIDSTPPSPTPTTTPMLPPPTSTPTEMSIPIITPTLTPTPSPTIDLRAVILIGPANGATFTGKNEQITLQWERWPVELKEEEYYFVDARFTGVDKQNTCREGWSYYKWTKETTLVVDSWLYDVMCSSPDKRAIQWTVYVGQPTNGLENPERRLISSLGNQWNFQWVVSYNSSPNNKSGGGGKTVGPAPGPSPD